MGGEWFVKRISNPAYKGVWAAREIDNPDYKEDDSVSQYADFGFIGFDLWQVKGGSIFDNIIITDDRAEADEFAKKWKAISEVEKAKKKDEAGGDDDDDDDDDLDEKKDGDEM